MRENRYSVGLYVTVLIIFPFLFMGMVFGLLSGCSEKSNQNNGYLENRAGKRILAELPEIGDMVTTERALDLCVHYGLKYLAKRIENDSDLFKEWEFDGCSMTPDVVLSELINVPSLTEICLRHDLGYAYGDPGNEKERIKVDRKFKNELLKAGASEFAAKVMFDAVRVGGREELCLSFSWGFARVEPCDIGFGLKLKE